MPMKKFQHIRVIHTTMPMKKLQHIRDIPGHCFSRHPRELMKDAVSERYRRANTGISLLPILFACEINIIFNLTFFFFDENIQIICLKLIFKEFCLYIETDNYRILHGK